MRDDSIPLIILGGSNSLYTSVFFVDEPPVDGIFFGESTECIARLFSLCADAKKNGLSKGPLLDPGVGTRFHPARQTETDAARAGQDAFSQ